MPGVAPSTSTDVIRSSPAPPPKEIAKQEITIKEITPVSEIPIIPEVKIKEILPSPSIEVTEYSSSKSPLIVREATSEKPNTKDDAPVKYDRPVVIEVQPSSAPMLTPSEDSTKISESNVGTKTTNDSPPSKISFSTQDAINSEIYPSNWSGSSTMAVPNSASTVITKAPVIEEEDPMIFEHNPAFPPLPDDLSVSRNHEDEILPEQVPEEHTQEVVIISRASSAPEQVTEATMPTTKEIFNKIQTTDAPFTTVNEENTSTDDSTLSTSSSEATTTTESDTTVVTTTIRTVPTYVMDLRYVKWYLAPTESVPTTSSTVVNNMVRTDDKMIATLETTTALITTEAVPKTASETVTQKEIETTPRRSVELSSTTPVHTAQETTTSSVAKSNEATEVTAQTELSSLPIETSDQNPKETPETSSKETVITSTESPLSTEIATSKISAPMETEVITVSRAAPSTDNESFENLETTEFIISSFGSSESATDGVELIKISAEQEQSEAIIEPTQRKKSNVLTELINLVGDVVSIGDHTEDPDAGQQTTSSITSISEFDELIPVNAGYKSKNSNWNLNSITETVPVKVKSPAINKLRIVEIEGEDADTITDPPPPNDKVEPTTKRPIIDNVSDDNKPNNQTSNKEIEIITKSYVPTINRRPTKVVMKINNEKPVAEETTEDTLESTNEQTGTESSATPVADRGTSTASTKSATKKQNVAIVVAMKEYKTTPAVQ